MMKQMRENTKVILWIVVVAFVVTIFAVWGLDLQGGGMTPAQQGTIGKVNGVAISQQQYQQIYQQLAAQARSSSPNNSLTYIQQELLRDQAWDNMVLGILTEGQVQRLGIRATDEEVLQYLRTSPPPEVRQYFLDDVGNFDFSAYQAALNNPDADWTSVEALARQRIPMLKLNQYLISSIHVSTRELRVAYEEESIKISAEYVRFPIEGNLSDFTPDDDAIRAYYDEHADEFVEDERAIVEYVKIDIAPNERDAQDNRTTADIVQDQLGDGDDFSMLARTYSQAPTAAADGNTGLLTRSQRDSQVMDVVDKMEVGAVSQPIETDQGIYLIKLLDKQTGDDGAPLYEMQEIFLELTAGAETIDELFTKAQGVQLKTAEADLATAANEHGLSVRTTEPFLKNFPIGDLGFVPSISRFAFSNSPGTVSSVLNDDTHYYICRLVEVVPEGVQALELVQNRISNQIAEERRNLATKRKAEAFRLSISTSQSEMADVAQTYNYTIERADTFVTNDNLERLGRGSIFALSALHMNIGDISPPVESGGAYYVLRVTERSEFDLAGFQERADAIGSRLYQEKLQVYMAYWYDKLKSEGDIEDYRGTL